MTWRSRRRGVFEELPRAVHRRTGRRYLDACTVGMVVNGVVVAAFGVVIVRLFVALSAGELAVFGVCSAAGYVVENLAAASHLRRVCAPVRAWFAGGATPPAWSAAAGLPVALVRRRRLYGIGAAASAAASLVVAALLDLPAGQAAWLLPVPWLLYVSSAVLRYIALELGMHPLLERSASNWVSGRLARPPALPCTAACW